MLPPVMNKEETLALPWPFLRVQLVHMDTAILNQVFIQSTNLEPLSTLLYIYTYFPGWVLQARHIYSQGCLYGRLI